ncbi:MAG: hypothetical protein RR324_07595 [Cellulosilyticaceae bacterium]
MINLKEELINYKPLLEIGGIEEEIEKEEIEDMIDIIIKHIKSLKE